MVDAKAASGKAINLGRKWGAEVKAKEAPQMHYPSLYVEKVGADSPLAKKEIGAAFTATVQFSVTGVRKGKEGVSVDLEARSLTL